MSPSIVLQIINKNAFGYDRVKSAMFRALHPSKLNIGHCQKAVDIVHLKSGYWILPTENGILGFWVH